MRKIIKLFVLTILSVMLLLQVSYATEMGEIWSVEGGYVALSVDPQGNVYGVKPGIPYDTGYGYGPTQPVAAVKLDTDGNVLWIRENSGTNPGYNTYQQGRDIAVDNNGNVFMIWKDISWGWFYFNVDTIKYDQNGNELWMRGFSMERWAYPFAITTDSDGDAYIAAYGITGWVWWEQQFYPVVIKYDHFGNQVWMLHLPIDFNCGFHPDDVAVDPTSWAADTPWCHVGGGYHPTAFDVAVDDNKYVYVTGIGGTVKYSMEYDVNGNVVGNLLWTLPFIGSAIAVDTGGNVYVTGQNGTAKFDTNGNQIWAEPTPASAIAIDSEGSAYVTGGNGTLKFDVAGNEVWKMCVGGFSIGVDSAKNVYISDGSIRKFPPDNTDRVPPSTSAALTGTSGSNDWYVSDVTVSLEAVDMCPGVKEIHYLLDGAETIVSGSTASFTITSDGEHDLSYWGVDNVGNIETPHPLSIKIDKTPPIITIFGVKDGAIYALGLVPKASYTATDAASGVATSSDSLTGGDGNGLGTFTYTVSAMDNAGNTVTASATYTVIAKPDVISLIKQMLASGQIDNAGIANSLISKINAALAAESRGDVQASNNIIRAFINQVEAQSGSHISTSAAAILINAATYIINNN